MPRYCSQRRFLESFVSGHGSVQNTVDNKEEHYNWHVFGKGLVDGPGVSGFGCGDAITVSCIFRATASFSAPIENPYRRIFWDWGLQMNYDLPFKLDKFINVPIWADAFDFDDRKRRDLDYAQQQQHQHKNNSLWHIADKYRSTDVSSADIHPSDFSAGELYYGLENLLMSYGFHETCLLRSVCELAHHPFDDERQNLISEILTFILTPSLHEGFADSELMYRDAYAEAERLGFLHYNCADMYRECKQDLLTSITNIANKDGI